MMNEDDVNQEKKEDDLKKKEDRFLGTSKRSIDILTRLGTLN
jgi:hypothetical protein